MFVGASGSVGIGTTAPGAKLEINGSGNDTTSAGISIANPTDGTAAGSKIGFFSGTTDASTGFIGAFSAAYTSSSHYTDRMVVGAGSAATGITLAAPGATQDVRMVTNATERMRIDSAGNVGIGTTSPDGRLHIAAPPNTWTTASWSKGLRLDGISAIELGGGAATKYGIGQSSSNLYIFDTTAEDNSAPANYRMTISGGNVGIGSVTPTSRLDVTGTVTATGLKLSTAPTNGYVLTSDGSGNGTWQAAAGTTWATPGAIGTTTPSTGAFSGVSIGTTAAGSDLTFGNGANRTIGVQSQATAGNNLTLTAGGTSGTNLNGGDLVLSSGTANGTGSSKIDFKTANGGAAATSMTILGNGNVGIGTTAPSNLLTVSLSDPSTAVGATAALALYNPDTTANNQSFISFRSNDTAASQFVGAKIGATYTNHTPGSTAADLTFMTVTTATNERMRITSGGNVGIGTTAPSQKLSVAGVIESTTGGVKFPDGTVRLSALGPSGILSARQLVVREGSTNPTYQVRITAAQITVTTAAGSPVILSGVDTTVDMTVSGAGGLDTGSEASSTWYYLWLIHNGSTTSGLFSLSATAPTLPGGYTYRSLVGAVRNDASGNIVPFQQIGRRINYVAMASALTTGSSGTWASVDLSSLVPATALEVDVDTLCTWGASSTVHGTCSIGYVSGSAVGNTTAYFSSTAYAYRDNSSYTLPLRTAQTIYYVVSNTNKDYSISVRGFTLE